MIHPGQGQGPGLVSTPTCFLGPDFAGWQTGLPNSQDVAGQDPELVIHPRDEVHHLRCLCIALDVYGICKIQQQRGRDRTRSSAEPGLAGGLGVSPVPPGGHSLVRICFHWLDRRVLASMRYLAMGLWLSKPRLQLSWTLVSPMSLTTTPPGGPGGPEGMGHVSLTWKIWRFVTVHCANPKFTPSLSFLEAGKPHLQL